MEVSIGSRCPKCNRLLDSEDVNVGTDTAFCKDCDEAFKLSEIVHDRETGTFELEDPPGGAWFGKTADGFIIGARTRSKIGCFLIPFAIVWSGGSLGEHYNVHIVIGESHKLIKSGPYKYVRHPAYLARLLSMIGIPLMLNAFFVLLAVAILDIVFIMARIGLEEKELMKKFGHEYLEYKRKVWTIVPFKNLFVR